MKMAGWLVLLVGCGFPKPADVGAPADAADADSPTVDAYDFGPHSHYVTSSIRLPTTSTEARAMSLDLNGDAIADNQLGSFIAAMSMQGIPSQPGMNKAIDQGTAISLIDIQTPSFAGPSQARFRTFVGEDPTPAACTDTTDVVCRHHLDGDATFALVHPTSAMPLVGRIENQTYEGSGGELTIMVSVMGASPVELALIGARARLTSPQPTVLSAGVIAGGITMTELDNQFFPSMQVSFTAQVAADCSDLTNPPNCGCTQSSAGDSLLGLFDTNPQDCAIAVDEIRNNSLIASALAPDLTINGTSALSFGYAFTAVAATFTAP